MQLARLGGPDTAADPPAINSVAALFIHGFGSDRQSWAGNAPALFDTVETYAVDLPAHGQCPPTISDKLPDETEDVAKDVAENTGSVDQLAMQLLESLDTAGLGSLHIIGHSLGAGIALAIAARQPARIQSLSLLAPAAVAQQIDTGFLQGLYQAQTVEQITELLHRLTTDPRLIGRQLPPYILSQLNKPRVREQLAIIAGQLESDYQNRHSDAHNNTDKTLTAVIEADIPRQIIWGINDQISSPDISLARQFCQQLHLIDKCGHLPHVEHRTQINNLLLSLIRDNIV